MFAARVQKLCPRRDKGPNVCHILCGLCFWILKAVILLPTLLQLYPTDLRGLSVENGVSDFRDDFLLDPQFIWKCVIDFQIFEALPDRFPKWVSCAVMSWIESILFRILVLFKIWDLLSGRSMTHLGEGSSSAWKRYCGCWVECGVSGRVGGQCCSNLRKPFWLYHCSERDVGIHFSWWICLFPLCLVPFFLDVVFCRTCRHRMRVALPFRWTDPCSHFILLLFFLLFFPRSHFKYSFFLPTIMSCSGVCRVWLPSWLPACFQCLHGVLHSAVSPGKTCSSPSPQDLWMWPYRKQGLHRHR